MFIGTDVTMTTSGYIVVEETQLTQSLEDCHKVPYLHGV